MIMQNRILSHHMSNYKDLSVVQVKSLPNISIRQGWEFWGFYGHSTINHDYNLKTIGGDKVIIDRATGLMWHQNGSITCMSWNDVQEWMVSLNNNGFAGYHDWRLPTVEEAASLLAPREGNTYRKLLIDPIFSNKQQWIWTGDKFGTEAMWHVNFSYGSVYWGLINSSYIFSNVRPVRSVE